MTHFKSLRIKNVGLTLWPLHSRDFKIVQCQQVGVNRWLKKVFASFSLFSGTLLLPGLSNMKYISGGRFKCTK